MQHQTSSAIHALPPALPPAPTFLPHLPLDALEHICSRLQLKDRVALASCCSVLWGRIDVLSSSVFWGQLDVLRPGNLKASSTGSVFAQSLAAWLWRRRTAVRRLAYDGQIADLTAVLDSLVGSSMEALAHSHTPSYPSFERPASQPMLPAEALRHTACLTGLEALQIRAGDLSSLPLELLSLPNLRSLVLANNQQLTLDRTEDAQVLQGLTDLTHLSVHRCALTTLPPALSLLTNLVDLDLGRNPFGSRPLAAENLPGGLLPDTRQYIWAWARQEFWPLQHLQTLTRLNLSDCDLLVLPPQLSCLTALSTCELEGNHLLGGGAEAWGGLAPLQQVPSLTHLNLSGCLLRRLPQLSTLTNLVQLELSMNWFHKGREGALQPLLKLTALRRLEIQDVWLEERPVELLALEERGVEIVF